MGIARVLEAVAKHCPMKCWLRCRDRVFWLVASPTRYRHYTYSEGGLELAVMEVGKW